MGGRSSHTVDPVVSRRYSSESEAVLVVRRRPSMVNGGGFVVSNNNQQVVFRVGGCGVLGTKGKLLLTNGDGENLLLIRKMGGIVQALNMVHKKWEGFGYDKEGTERLVFTLKDPKDSCLVHNNNSSSIIILVHGKPKKLSTHKSYVGIKGSFTERDCNIMNSDGRAIAKVRRDKEMEEEMVGEQDDGSVSCNSQTKR
ncbi:PREDICTED: protein LURP-one-related 16-like isoform X1 [Camelina sativa]|uniref:Protein LURP-one-related 16-like isoform X1 n=1 Tax=Camelina sativa TaxID=90675 RepID=A0ABM1QAW8_CAMSA|nr:PREDICTED: protein LURP-one-related 16-like isoform X1 [Camelina sativa]